LKPSESRYHKALGDCFLQQAKNEPALIEYQSALEESPMGTEAGDIKSKIDYLKTVLKRK
jgi:predicted negative regulator of RcsB-dependent stress response